MTREDYGEIIDRLEKATGNEVFCDVMCRFPNELNEEQLTEVCERCPLNNTLDKIREEIERQEKWLWQAGINPYNVDIALDAIKSVVAESEE